MSAGVLLASASPQRRALLEGIGLPHTVQPSAVDESTCTETDPQARAQALATMKAEAVAAQAGEYFVLGADTLVVAGDGTLLEKPRNADDVRRMLRLHSGNASTVYSAICLVTPEGKTHEAVSASVVHFAELSEEDIEWWINTGAWQDRSGAFQIEGKGQLLVRHLEGDWTGVVGLPMFIVGELLRRYGLVSEK